MDRVVYTASQAEFHQLDFVVRHPSRERPITPRAVPVLTPRFHEGESPECQGIPLVVPGIEASDRCGGIYRVAPCVIVEVPSSGDCVAPENAEAERWTLTLLHDELRLADPAGQEARAPTAKAMAETLSERARQARVMKALEIRRHPALPFIEELEARAFLVGAAPHLFAAAFVRPGADEGEIPPPPPSPPVAPPPADICGGFGRIARILVDERPVEPLPSGADGGTPDADGGDGFPNGHRQAE